jgi:hypothetical protein
MRDGINRRPRWTGALTAAFAVMALMAVLMIWGPWNPRLVQRDMAGNDIGTSTKTMSP